LKPEIVRLCITVIRNADKGMSFTAAIRASAEKRGGLGSKVLAEGVETAAQRGVAELRYRTGARLALRKT
jgi:EAL domain-containing protein (putative c-di-GMP-specific phosphodiesterase class I)